MSKNPKTGYTELQELLQLLTEDLANPWIKKNILRLIVAMDLVLNNHGRHKNCRGGLMQIREMINELTALAKVDHPSRAKQRTR